MVLIADRLSAGAGARTELVVGATLAVKRVLDALGPAGLALGPEEAQGVNLDAGLAIVANVTCIGVLAAGAKSTGGLSGQMLVGAKLAGRTVCVVDRSEDTGDAELAGRAVDTSNLTFVVLELARNAACALGGALDSGRVTTQAALNAGNACSERLPLSGRAIGAVRSAAGLGLSRAAELASQAVGACRTASVNLVLAIRAVATTSAAADPGGKSADGTLWARNLGRGSLEFATRALGAMARR
jgi:hypothetical protein